MFTGKWGRTQISAPFQYKKHLSRYIDSQFKVKMIVRWSWRGDTGTALSAHPCIRPSVTVFFYNMRFLHTCQQTAHLINPYRITPALRISKLEIWHIFSEMHSRLWMRHLIAHSAPLLYMLTFNTLRPKLNGLHFTDDIFQMHFLEWQWMYFS